MGRCGACYEYEYDDKKDLHADQRKPVVERQTDQRQERSKGIALTGGMHSRVKIGKTQKSYRCCKKEDHP
jgi:hypothetical protein